MFPFFLDAALVTLAIGAVAVQTTHSAAQDDEFVILNAIMQQAGCGCPSGEPSMNNPKARR